MFGQIDYSANDQVPDYQGGFRFGTNMGAPQGEWSDQTLATLAAGSETLGLPGAGCNALRLSLPHHFLEKWGYDIRVNTVKYYHKDLGMDHHTLFIGYPALDDRESKVWCEARGASKLFAKMYEPIWDGGKNGTPVNDNNPMALYLYKTALKYNETVTFWEVWNEPDYTRSDKGWQSRDADDSWWKRDPAPCELNNLLAPVQHYIRALRIAYEVVKFVDPEAFICIGGIGYDSFLDAILRNTDNPDQGKVTSQYPLKGGAWFDCLSYHNYPMYGLRAYENGNWVPYRHSDKAVEVFINAKKSKEQLLASYGYDNKNFPKKRVIVTETNLPRQVFQNFIGSEAAQNNYLAKIIIKGQANNIDQIHTFCLYDSEQPSNPYHVMGFYPNLKNVKPYQQVEHQSAVLARNTMSLLKGHKYDPIRTAELKIPDQADGAAFKDQEGHYIYALWAKTSKDNDETTAATYQFPDDFGAASCTKFKSDYTLTGQSQQLSSTTVELNGTPSFFKLSNEIVLSTGYPAINQFKVFPNPSLGLIIISAPNLLNKPGHLVISNSKGQDVYHNDISGQDDQKIISGLPPDLYLFQYFIDNERFMQKVLVK